MLEGEPLETIHLYIVREEEEQPVVDSTVQDTAKIVTQPLVQKPRSKHSFLVPLIIVAVNLSVVLAVFFIHIYPILTATATITIIPKSYRLTERLTLSNIQSRIFQPVTLTQNRTVPATGKGHQDATHATGTITLYNASIQEQTIDAGTLLIGSDGQHIVTDQAATIPGATPPIEGQVTVSAHAVNPGAAGNIQAGEIQGACCRDYVFAYNSAFSGGADQRDYTIVTKQDIARVISSVVPTLTKQINASFHQQIRPGEIPTPNQCSQKVLADRNVGGEASNVTVTVSESCLAGAYTSSDFQTKIRQALSQQANQTVGTGYLLSSYVQTTPTQASIQHGRLVLSAIYHGIVIFHFSSQELTTLRQQLAGKSRQQGIAILTHLNGAEHITIQLGKNGTFPTDPTHIHIVFLLSQ